MMTDDVSNSQQDPLDAAEQETAFSRFGGGGITNARRTYGSSKPEDSPENDPIGNVIKNNQDLLEMSQAEIGGESSLFALTNDNDDDDAPSQNFACTTMNSDDEQEESDGEDSLSKENVVNDGSDETDDDDEQEPAEEEKQTSRGRTKRPFSRSVLESMADDETPSESQEKTPSSKEESQVDLSDKNDEDEKEETTPADDTVAEKESPSNDDTKKGEKTTKPPPTKDQEKQQPDHDALITSIDNLFVHADIATVTIRDIVNSLEAEYDVKFKKSTKAIVRTHLTDLIKGHVEPSVESNASSESEQEEEESDAGDALDTESSSDEEDEVKAPAKRKRTKKPTKRISPRQKNSKKKPSHVRIHAEMLRKRRIEELRVRNEELQVKQNKEDQKRAEQIAAKFETDTDELRLKRLEDRLDLLRKLDQKRIRVVSDESNDPGKAVKQEKDEEANVSTSDDKVPSAAPTEESDDDSDDDFELEIVGKDAPTALSKTPSSRPAAVTKSSAINMLDMVGGLKPKPKRAGVASFTADQPQASPGKSMSARAALRNSLRAKQRKGANMWLARELGYKTQEEHMRDCLLAEQKKREDVVKREEERLKANERKALRERMLLESNPYVEEEEEEFNPDAEEAGDGNDDGNESDEEMAMARELEEEKDAEMPPADDSPAEPTSSSDDVDPVAQEENEPAQVDNSATESDKKDPKEVTATTESPSVSPGNEASTLDTTLAAVETEGVETTDDNADAEPADVDAKASNEPNPDDKVTPVEESDMTMLPDSDMPVDEDINVDRSGSNPEAVSKSTHADNDSDEFPAPSEDDDAIGHNEGENTHHEDSSESEPVEEVKEKKAPKDKNAGWKAMLEKEAAKLKKQKAGKNGKGLVEAEADEEEEEEVAGLEDFGFSLGNKKKDDDEAEDADADKLTEEDLKHVVDDVSDDEGDEEAGQAARKKLEQMEEKERHKEIIRRMREGYDGRRGGIAGSGVGARGMHRFDQLVAADNREDAKRLGLLNDDELDSEDDEPKGDGNGDDEEDDENALLDKMLKDRFLHRSSLDEEVQENFSSDEEEEEEVNEDKDKDANDDDEKEQERLAKRFSKRARMQRLIEQHGEDEEFSQLRLIDEDENTRLELKMMKSVSHKSRGMSDSSSRSTLLSSDSRESSLFFSSSSTKRSSSLALGTSSLSLALQASRTSKKKKTSFLGGGASKEVSVSSSVHKCVSMGHVVFNTGGDSQLSKQGGQSSRSNLGGAFNHTTKGKRKRTTMQTSTSLWSKVAAANGFNKNKKRARN